MRTLILFTIFLIALISFTSSYPQFVSYFCGTEEPFKGASDKSHCSQTIKRMDSKDLEGLDHECPTKLVDIISSITGKKQELPGSNEIRSLLNDYAKSLQLQHPARQTVGYLPGGGIPSIPTGWYGPSLQQQALAMTNMWLLGQYWSPYSAPANGWAMSNWIYPFQGVPANAATFAANNALNNWIPPPALPPSGLQQNVQTNTAAGQPFFNAFNAAYKAWQTQASLSSNQPNTNIGAASGAAAILDPFSGRTMNLLRDLAGVQGGEAQMSALKEWLNQAFVTTCACLCSVPAEEN